jgi:hypothetical protein
MTISGETRGDSRFDVRQFARTAKGNHRDTLDLTEFEGTPLSEDHLRLVRYFSRLESATMEHLRNLLVTATHKDARVTAFLVTWAFEKFWIADALDAVLEANGLPRAQSIPEGKKRTSLSEHNERRGPIRRAISAMGLGVPIIGVHMTSGLVDEWIMESAYQQLSADTTSKGLRSTIAIILEVKKRHAAFFLDETRRRLAESARSVKQTRKALALAVFPIGAVDRAADDRDFFDTWLFAGDQGRARLGAIENLVSQLPGMDQTVAASIARRLSA